MTEAEWLATYNPSAMLAMLMFQRGDVSQRKLRFFAVSCGRLVSHGRSYSEAENIFSLSEGYAEHRVDKVTLRAGNEQAIAYAEVAYADRQSIKWNALWAAAYSAEESVEVAVDDTLGFVRSSLGPIPDCTLCSLARDIFGNPFRPVAVDPDWLTSTVVALARGIYDERVFDRMPILADALQDAGCDNADVLTHCRGDGPHVRGCWVVDLLLGKS